MELFYYYYFFHSFSALEPGIFTQEIAGFGTAVNTTYEKVELFKQFRWNLVCGSYLTQGE